MKINLTRLLECKDIPCPEKTTGDWQFDVGSRTDESTVYSFEKESTDE